MPLTARHDFAETAAGATVRVQLSGVPRSQIDVCASEVYIKVNAPPYFFEADLLAAVDDERTVAAVDATGVTFTLHKREEGLWGRLTSDLDKAARRERRAASISAAHDKANAKVQAKKEQKASFDKVALERQMKIEDDRRSLIEARKAEEIAREVASISQWKDRTRTIPTEEEDSDWDGDDDSDNDEEGFVEQSVKPAEPVGPVAPSATGFKPPKAPTQEEEDEETEEEKAERLAREERVREERLEAKRNAAREAKRKAARANRAMPNPRAAISVPVGFTELEQDHMPARENRELEIKEWKRKNNVGPNAGKRDGRILVPDDAQSMAEREPIFLKDKGDSLLKAGNHSGALNAYTSAIEIELQAPHPDGTLARLFSNRAVCFRALTLPMECVADCTEALGLLAEQFEDAPSDAERDDIRSRRVKLLLRRAEANVEKDDLLGAKNDYLDALRLEPKNERIQRDLEEVEACIKPLDAPALKARGDERFRAGDVQGAADAYGAVLELADVERKLKLMCLSNRATCSFKLEDWGAAVDDCERGLRVALDGTGRSPAEATAWAAELAETAGEGAGEEWAPDGGELYASLIKLLTRRGAARSHLADYTAAAADYTAAAQLHRAAGDTEKADKLAGDAVTVAGLAQ